MDSLTGEGEPPEAYESWLEHLTHLAAEAMAEALDIEGIVTDKTLTVDGGIADAKAAGDALALKADKSTTYTKTEVDQMIEDVEVETDTTLEVAGAAADSKKVGDELTAIKADLDDVNESLGDVANNLAPIIISADSIDDNPYETIQDDGSVVETPSAIGVSNLYRCKSGGVLDYALSTQNGKLVLAVYDANMTLMHYVSGSGMSTLVRGSYSFVEGDAFFRFSGVITGVYRDSYVVSYYHNIPNVVMAHDLDVSLMNTLLTYETKTEVKSLVSIPGAVKTNGAVNEAESVASTYSYSDYIRLRKGSKIIYQGVRVTNLCAIAPYSDQKVFDSTNAVISSTTISGVWTMPYNGYVRLCCRNTELSGNASFVVINPIGAEIDSLDARVSVLEGEIPDVWKTYLEAKKTDIKSALVAIGASGETFTFVTDCHVPRNNMLTPKIIKELEKTCPVNYHINGGDFIDINTDSAQSAINVLWNWKDAMNGMKEYSVRGNHDDNNYNGKNSANVLSVGQFYAVMDRQIENLVNTGGKTYYCIDNQSQKIRIIVLDSSLASKTDMYAWMSTKLTELDNTWTILVIQHYLWGSTIDTIHANGQATIDAINAVYSQINADFIGILAGHTHVDNNDTETVNGYLLIARDTNMIKGGTGTESLSFDYVTINTSSKTINFTKVGRGSDLSLSYAR
jgi:hypothetical protein